MQTYQQIARESEANWQQALPVLEDIAALVTLAPSDEIRTSYLTKCHPIVVPGWSTLATVYVAEASELRWKPECWPGAFHVIIDTKGVVECETPVQAVWFDRSWDGGELVKTRYLLCYPAPFNCFIDVYNY